ncbi:MAG: glycosyltransferase domain-containing protein, partial [Gammaproteobacteria bacterium]
MSTKNIEHAMSADPEWSGRGSVVVYTAVTSRYDLVLPPARQSAPLAFCLFDDTGVGVRGWHGVPFRRSFDCSVTTNRFHKFFAHELFPDAEYSIYLDGNIGIVGDLAPLIDEFIASECAIGWPS